MERRRRSTGLRARLIAIALLPLLGMAVFAGTAIVERRDDARCADRVVREVSSVSLLLRLQLHLDEELIPSQAMLQASSFGLTTEQASGFLGFDMAAEVGNARTAVDETFARIAADGGPDLSREQRSLAQVRAGVDDGSISVAELRSQVGSIMDDVRRRSSVLLDDVAALGVKIRSAEVQRTTAQLTEIYALVNVAGSQLPMLFFELVGDLTGSPPTSTLDLAETTGWYRRTAEEIDDTVMGPLAVAWTSMRGDPNVRLFEAALDDVLVDGSPSLTLDDLDQLGAIVAASFARSVAHVNVFEAAAVDAVTAARTASSDAREMLSSYAALVALSLAATVGLLLLVARSINRPLRRLVSVAERVDQGNITSLAMPPSRGPREVRVVADALGELVDGLKVLDAQTFALAHGHLDDPVLQVHRPGRLASNLRDSVELLSRSMAERDRLHEQLRHDATHDSVTGLPNRSALLDTLSGALERYRSRVASLGLLVIQLDGLRRANDVHGHDVGDAVLAEAGERLRKAAGGVVELARLGDDEFIAVAEDETLDELVAFGDRIVQAFRQAIEVASRVVYLTPCVGIARAHDSSTTRAELMRGAGIAAQRARTLGRSRVEVFDDDLRGALVRTAELERALSAALTANELSFELQPVWDLQQHRASGFEALARWTRPDGTRVSPADFIAAAELSDLIIELDNFVMHAAAGTVARWNAANGCNFSVAVNISGRHLLSRRVIDDVRETLRVSGLAADHLVIEITETVVLTDLEIATAHLGELRRLGVRIAIDDFGSGYTSLVHLRTLPADILKIDGSFVADLDTAEGRSLMKVIVEAAHTMELSLVAEGVETAAQLQELERLGCDEVQGYHLGRPMPVAEADQLFVSSLPPVD